MISTLKQQAKDLWVELHDRVEWPEKKKVISSTNAVVAVSFFMGAFLWASDLLISWVMKFILPQH